MDRPSFLVCYSNKSLVKVIGKSYLKFNNHSINIALKRFLDNTIIIGYK